MKKPIDNLDRMLFRTLCRWLPPSVFSLTVELKTGDVILFNREGAWGQEREPNTPPEIYAGDGWEDLTGGTP